MPDEKYQFVGGRMAEEMTSWGYRKRKSSKTEVESRRKGFRGEGGQEGVEECEWSGLEWNRHTSERRAKEQK
jgi:hypothetical protein